MYEHANGERPDPAAPLEAGSGGKTLENAEARWAGSFVVRRMRARLVDVPLAEPQMTGGGAIRSLPFVLLDLDYAHGVTGSIYMFSYDLVASRTLMTLLSGIGGVIEGQEARPSQLRTLLEARFRLLGVSGLIRFALSAIDTAAWDALAKSADLSLCRLLGGEPRPVPAYASFFMAGVEGAVRDATVAREKGFTAAKFKIGYPSIEEEHEVLQAARSILGPDAAIMVDYNQSLSAAEAFRRLEHHRDIGLYWVEEPIDWRALEANAALSMQSGAKIQLGENWWGLDDLRRSLKAKASDYAMLSLHRIGGVSAWVEAAQHLFNAGIPVSSHTYQNASVQLLAALPNAHWLECSGKADAILSRHLDIVDGKAQPFDRPGLGIEWDEAAVERYLTT